MPSDHGDEAGAQVATDGLHLRSAPSEKAETAPTVTTPLTADATAAARQVKILFIISNSSLHPTFL